MKHVLITLFGIAIFGGSVAHATQPNVIIITVDDMNDWIEPLGGHPDAITPKLTQFADTGAVIFRNAACPAPVCGPSRSAFLSGYMPNRTGVYNNGTQMRNSTLVQNNPTLPEYFRYHGYYTLSTGKVFHGHRTDVGEDQGQWAFDKFWDNANSNSMNTTDDSYHDIKTSIVGGDAVGDTNHPTLLYDGAGFNGLKWGVTNNANFTATKDYKKADWGKDHLDGTESLQEPFFMAVGIYKPHLPWDVPQEFFDLYPLADVDVPYMNPNDLDDIEQISNGNDIFSPSTDYEWAEAYSLHQKAAQAYLACISQSDRAIGVILDELESGPYANNTIVVIMGDHGWHLGEKLQYQKNLLWIESIKTPLIVRTPATKTAYATAQYCDNPVNLIDVFPTLVDLCGLEAKNDIDGTSFSAMLSAPATDTGSVTTTVSSTGNSVLSKRYHLIQNRYNSNSTNPSFPAFGLRGSEFYDLDVDPYEETNLIDSTDPTIVTAIASLMTHVPASFTPSVQSATGTGPKNFLDATIRDTRLAMDYDSDGRTTLEELFEGTNAAVVDVPSQGTTLNAEAYLNGNSKMAFRYGAPTGLFSSLFTYDLYTTDDLAGVWSPMTATQTSVDPAIFEVEFESNVPQQFMKLELQQTPDVQ